MQCGLGDAFRCSACPYKVVILSSWARRVGMSIGVVVPRVLGSLAVSRGIGDQSLKQWVTIDPVSKIFKIGLELEFMIMTSDELWEVSNQEAIDLARSFCVGHNKLKPVLSCKKLVEFCVS